MKFILCLLVAALTCCTHSENLPEQPSFPRWNGFFLYNWEMRETIHYVLTGFENGSPRTIQTQGISCGDIDDLESSVCFPSLRNTNNQWVLEFKRDGSVFATLTQNNGCTLVYQASVFHENYTINGVTGTLYVVKAASRWFKQEQSICTE